MILIFEVNSANYFKFWPLFVNFRGLRIAKSTHIWCVNIEVEQTVQCSRTVQFLVMFGRFKVRSLAKIRCSDMFKIRLWWFWIKLCSFFINKVREQFGYWWRLRGSKFGFGYKRDVRMCSKFDPLRFEMFEVRFFDVRSTSSIIY